MKLTNAGVTYLLTFNHASTQEIGIIKTLS